MSATHEERQGHTAGPWWISGKSIIRAGKDSWIADVNWRNREANARLIAASPMLLDAVRKLVGAVEDLISESHGVYGLHLNGDPAPWSDLTAGGSFEGWLLPLEEARAAIAAAEGRS